MKRIDIDYMIYLSVLVNDAKLEHDAAASSESGMCSYKWRTYCTLREALLKYIELDIH